MKKKVEDATTPQETSRVGSPPSKKMDGNDDDNKMPTLNTMNEDDEDSVDSEFAGIGREFKRPT